MGDGSPYLTYVISLPELGFQQLGRCDSSAHGYVVAMMVTGRSTDKMNWGKKRVQGER